MKKFRTKEEDPALADFLSFLANDIQKNPGHLRALSPALADRARALVSKVEIDLDAPLSDKDEDTKRADDCKSREAQLEVERLKKATPGDE